LKPATTGQHRNNIARTLISAISVARIPPLVLALPLAVVTLVFSFAVVATIQASVVSSEKDHSLLAAGADARTAVSYQMKIRLLEERIAELEQLVPVKNASLGPVEREEPYAITPLQEERNIFKRYVDSLLQPAENCQEWQTVDERVRLVLTDASRHFGAPVLMTSCYRSAAYNRAIYKRMGRRVTRSQHIFRKAIDAKIADVSSAKLAAYVRTHPVMRDLGGIGTYCNSPGMVHVDVGPRRNWHWACRREPSRARFAKRHKRTT
jgi:hypothetical protein